MITLDATLTTLGPLSIGTGVVDANSDRPVVCDQHGRPVIPGTSLAGALRAAAVRRYGPSVAARLFGPASAGADDLRRRSPVIVSDAPFAGEDFELPPVMLRQHVAIDRERLAAQDELKFDAETWPLKLPFRLRLDTPDDELAYLQGVLDEVEGPAGGLGAGACRIEVRNRRVSRPGDLDRVLRAAMQRYHDPHVTVPREEDDPPPDAAEGVDAGRVAVVLQLRLSTVLPLACREPKDPFSSDRDNDPFTVVVRHDDGSYRRQPGIPGTSLRGVLRQRAERALAAAGVDPFDPPQNPVLATFGTAGDDDGGGRAGAVIVEDALAADIEWQLETVDASQDGCIERPRVKLDRLTHSPLGGAFFDDTLVADGVELEARITIAPPDREVTDRDVALVAIGLRDIAAGAAGVGGSTRAGYGTLEVKGGTVTSYQRTARGLETEQTTLQPDAGTVGWDTAWSERIRAAWKEFTHG